MGGAERCTSVAIPTRPTWQLISVPV